MAQANHNGCENRSSRAHAVTVQQVAAALGLYNDLRPDAPGSMTPRR
jgi:hypothetical protein